MRGPDEGRSGMVSVADPSGQVVDTACDAARRIALIALATTGLLVNRREFSSNMFVPPEERRMNIRVEWWLRPTDFDSTFGAESACLAGSDEHNTLQ